MRKIGWKVWAIAEGYIPLGGHGPKPEFECHETICILNCGKADAHIEITIFFRDRSPAGPFRVDVPAERTLHQRTNDFKDPEVIPRGTDYSMLIESDVPIVVQHTRLDSRQAANSIFTTIAYHEEAA